MGGLSRVESSRAAASGSDRSDQAVLTGAIAALDAYLVRYADSATCPYSITFTAR